MPIAAVPEYLGKHDLTSASPGLRFGMYLPLWGRNNRTGELLWTSYDINYRVAGQNRQERKFEDENKTGSLKQAMKLNRIDNDTTEKLLKRQSSLASSIGAGSQLLTLDARSVAPFTTGLGNEHPLENGFAFLWPYGLPYLPGSGIKGVLRQAARELAPGVTVGDKWIIESGWDEQAINALFGREDSNDACRGALSFWDVIPKIQNNNLMVEVMTPHQGHYYQKGEPPHDSGKPTPINFLTVPPDSGFTFHVVCDQPFLYRIAPDLAKGDRWKALLTAAFEHAFHWLGFGAKTAVGYGAMALDAEAMQRRSVEEEERARQQQEQETLARATANLPEDAAWIETQRVSGAWSDVNAFLGAVEAFLEEREELTAEAHQRLAKEMEQRWKGITVNPDTVQGKKQKPKFKPRPRKVVKRMNSMVKGTEDQ